MNGMIRILIAALVLQVGLAAVLLLQDNGLSTYVPDEPFVSVQLSELSKIEIDNKETSETIDLVKKDGTWVLENHFGFPVSKAKLEAIGDKLLKVKRPLAVGSTTIAEKQFEVAADKYKQKISLFKADDKPVETIYLGTSPGFKKVHARKEGEDGTYAITFSPYDIQTKEASWIDRDFLKLDRSSLAKISFADVSLTLDDKDSARLSDLKDNESLKQEEVDSFIRTTTQPPFSEVVGLEVKPEYGLNEPDMEYSLELKDGKQLHFRVAQNGDKDKFYLTRSDVPYVFEITKYQFESLQKERRSALVQEKIPAVEDGNPTKEADGQLEDNSGDPNLSQPDTDLSN